VIKIPYRNIPTATRNIIMRCLGSIGLRVRGYLGLNKCRHSSSSIFLLHSLERTVGFESIRFLNDEHFFWCH